MKTRTLVVFGLAIGMVVACLGIATAVFTPVSKETVAGGVVFTGAPSGEMTVALKKISNDSVATEISWSDVTAAVTEWKAADQYIEVTNTYNGTGWGIQIYTDNCAGDANPQFYTVNPSSVNPAGLLAIDNKKDVLPLAWRTMGEKVTSGSDELDIQQVPDPIDPDKYHLQPSKYAGDVYYPWLWMKDARTPDIPEQYTEAFVNGEDYVTIWNENGVHHAEGPGDYYASPSPNYVYIGARFTTATTPRTYRTNKLTVELFWQ
jgi:hypothetical protein